MKPEGVLFAVILLTVGLAIVIQAIVAWLLVFKLWRACNRLKSIEAIGTRALYELHRTRRVAEKKAESSEDSINDSIKSPRTQAPPTFQPTPQRVQRRL
mgnify:CR=1 FL=1